MKALLIYPEFPDTFWSFKHSLKFINKKSASPPLGLLTVAAMLPEQWEKRLLDLNVTKLTEKDLAWADYALISAMAVQNGSAKLVIARCKQAGVTVIAGGPLFTSEYEQFQEVDHFVLNEAELTLPPFLADLKKGNAQRVYETVKFADVKKTPAPLWELVNLKWYASMSIQFSRGCPYYCDFCNVTALFGRIPRVKTVDQILAELNSLYNLGWRGSIFFVDDNFIGDKRYLKQVLLPKLINWQRGKQGITFFTEAPITLADDQSLMNLMAAAGFNAVFIGIETPDEASLDECGKMQNKNRDLVKDVKKLQQTGFEVQGGFIVGFDSDTESIFQRQIDFIQKSGIVTAMVGLLQAPKGTKLYEKLKKIGRLAGTISGDNVDGTTNIIPIMSIKTLREGHKSILQYIYSPENYYQRIRTFLREYQPQKKQSLLSLNKIKTFFRSVFCLGILGKERFYYWQLLFWTYFRRPELFGLAVTFAIHGRHFRKVAESLINSNSSPPSRG